MNLGKEICNIADRGLSVSTRQIRSLSPGLYRLEPRTCRAAPALFTTQMTGQIAGLVSIIIFYPVRTRSYKKSIAFVFACLSERVEFPHVQLRHLP